MNTYEVAITVTETKIYRVEAPSSYVARKDAEERDIEGVPADYCKVSNRTFRVKAIVDTAE